MTEQETSKVVVHYSEDGDGTKTIELIIRDAKTRILFTIANTVEDSGWIIVSKELDVYENGPFPEKFIDDFMRKIVDWYEIVE